MNNSSLLFDAIALSPVPLIGRLFCQTPEMYLAVGWRHGASSQDFGIRLWGTPVRPSPRLDLWYGADDHHAF